MTQKEEEWTAAVSLDEIESFLVLSVQQVFLSRQALFDFFIT